MPRTIIYITHPRTGSHFRTLRSGAVVASKAPNQGAVSWSSCNGPRGYRSWSGVVATTRFASFAPNNTFWRIIGEAFRLDTRHGIGGVSPTSRRGSGGASWSSFSKPCKAQSAFK
jgi:hypothetical protein